MLRKRTKKFLLKTSEEFEQILRDNSESNPQQLKIALDKLNALKKNLNLSGRKQPNINKGKTQLKENKQ